MTDCRVLPVDVPGRPHDVLLGRGLLDRLGSLVHEVLPPAGVAVVTDDVVAPFYLARAAAALGHAGFAVTEIVVPAGEGTKSLAACERIWTRLGEAGIERGGALIALGGGVVGDLAGYCAASWLRGVPVVQVPTTVLAMADAAIGGKTGVNLALGKNLVGAFHMPRRVVADIDTLATLGRRDVSAGLAEVVKCALLDDRRALGRLRARAADLLAGDPEALLDAVTLGASTKVRIVAEDPFEQSGRRAWLNLGHTVAHALETERGHGALRHGEAVAIGLAVESRVAVSLGLAGAALADEIVATLEALGLPVALPTGTGPEALVELTRRDKKTVRGTRQMVLVLDAGGAQVVAVSDDALRAAFFAR